MEREQRVRIAHICLSGVVTDGFSYQDNLLSKYHKRMGHEVTFITSKWIFNDKGEIVQIDKEKYINEDGVKMIRLSNRRGEKFGRKFKHFIGLFDALVVERPEVLFIHGPQFLEMPEVVRYAQKYPVKIYVDNHADFSNSGRNFLSKYILQGIIWRHMAQIIEPYTRKFYGVLPARVDWLKNMYKLPANKCELLVMGADDDFVQDALSEKSKKEFRQKYGIKDDDFLIVTGGKIDLFKRQTLLLMKAIHNIKNNDLKLVIFGSVQKDMKDKLNALCDGHRVQYIGWAQGNQSYKYMGAADLVAFPGRHSVYWEQAAGMGKPLLCKYWDGTTHIDVGGNVKFLYEDSVDMIQNIIETLLKNGKEEYKKMLGIAQGKGRERFSYTKIAEKSLELKM